MCSYTHYSGDRALIRFQGGLWLPQKVWNHWPISTIKQDSIPKNLPITWIKACSMYLYMDRFVGICIGGCIISKNRNRNASVNLQNNPHSCFPWVADHSVVTELPEYLLAFICFCAATSITQAREKESIILSFHLFGMLTSLFVGVAFNNKPVNLLVNKGTKPCL